MTQRSKLQSPWLRAFTVGISILATSTCALSPSFAGPNARGTLIVHNCAPCYCLDSDEQEVCTNEHLPATCDDIVTRHADGTEMTVWVILASFPPESSPRLSGLTFGIEFDPSVVVASSETCGDFELPMDNWPASGSGVAVTFAAPRTGTFEPIYWFAGYEYYGVNATFRTAPHPTQGGNFGDDSVPSVIDPIHHFGWLGFNGDPGLLQCAQQALGACCFDDQHCELLSFAECALRDGTYVGDEIGCDQEPCGSREGACCRDDGTCQYIAAHFCDETFLGYDIPCDPLPCPSACCLTDGTCQLITLADCTGQGGIFYQGLECTPTPCTAAGACCFYTDCVVLTSGQCLAQGGIFLGEGTSCAGDPCLAPDCDGALRSLSDLGFEGDLTDQPGPAAVSTGFGEATIHTSERGLGCGALVLNSDETYENALAWRYGGIAPPCFGAFAEGYESIDGTICSVVFDFSTTGTQNGQSMDVFVWEDAFGMPGAVVAATLDVDPGTIAFWPSASRHVVSVVTPSLSGDHWVGFWGNWPGEIQGWFVAADLNGFGGAPRTNIAPAIGYPTGWQDVSIVWGSTQALGIGFEISGTDAGACCYPNGACLVRLEEDCAGTFLGAGTICVPNECEQPPDGACCFPDGSCVFVDSFACGDLGGEYLGDGLVCEPNPCPEPPDGACCFLDGTCVFIDTFECADLGGDYRGDGLVCDPNPCPKPGFGACCLLAEDRCENLFDYQCDASNGYYLGDGTDCALDSCPAPCGAPLSMPSTPSTLATGGRGPNAGGTLILHYDGISYTSDQSNHCGLSDLSDCQASDTRVDEDIAVVFHVYAAFPEPARLAGLTFGVYYQDCFILNDHGPCGDFELPDSQWPASDTGTAVTWSTAQTSQLVEIYWFAGYVDGGQSTDFALGPHPTQGGNFADDDVPSNIDPIAGFGWLGFHRPGGAPCPGSGEAPGACCFPDGSCVVLLGLECEANGGTFLGEGTSCDPSPCSSPIGACCFPDGSCFETSAFQCDQSGGIYQGDATDCSPNPCTVPTGACCIEDTCFQLTQPDCEAQGGQFLGAGVPCESGICVAVPVRDVSWGRIKSLFR